MQAWPRETVRKFLAARCRDDYRAFVKYALGFAAPWNPKAGWWEEAHDKFCVWIQLQFEEWLETRPQREEPLYLLVMACRGFGKTVIGSKSAAAWLNLHDPNLATQLSSIESSTSTEIADYLRTVYENKDPKALFTWLYGKWEGRDTWTKARFTHAARRLNLTDATLETTSVESGATGKHPDVVKGDDFISLEKIREEGTWCVRAKQHVTSLTNTLLPVSIFIYFGTPYVDGDTCTSMIREDGVCSVAGVKLPPEYARHVRPDGKWRLFHLPARDHGGIPEDGGPPTIPRTRSEKFLHWLQNNRPAEYASQYMLCPGSSDLSPLSYAQIEEMVVEGGVPKHLPVSIHFDTAFKSAKKMGSGDESVILLAEHDHRYGDVYFTWGKGSNSWRDDDFIAELVALVQRLRAQRRRILAITDDKPIGGHFGGRSPSGRNRDLWRGRLENAFIDAGMFLPRFLQIDRAGTKKDERISEAAGYWIDGHVRILKNAGLEKLMEQMARIGVAHKKDWADAAADAFHPEIYIPMQLPEMDAEPPPPMRPLDEYLKTGKITPAAVYEIDSLAEELRSQRGLNW